jgi:hypothetical protein
MILIKRRYATRKICSSLIPALKCRAKIRGRYAAKNYALQQWMNDKL